MDDASNYKEIEKIFKNGFHAEPIYQERMAHFYLKMDNCEENLYRYVTETMGAARNNP